MENVVNSQLLHEHYRNKKVFVTGHTGFKGAWLTAMLHSFGAMVKGYALQPEHKQDIFNVLSPLNMCDSVIGDIRDKKKLESEILSFKPDYVFHLAAQPLVRKSYAIPAETFEVNVTGTANLLEAMTRLNERCSAVIITTDKVYENKEQDVLYQETDRLGGYDPYSASKACAELVISSFRNSFFNPKKFSQHQKAIAAARAGNVIGGGDWNEDRLMPDIVRSLQQNTTIALRNPNAVRPWQHVLEPLAGYLMLAAKLNMNSVPSPAYNFGPLPGDHLTVKELVSTAIGHWGHGNWKDISENTQPHEAQLLQLDIQLAARELSCTPKLTSTEAVRWTLDWYKQPMERQAEFTLQQIEKYLSL